MLLAFALTVSAVHALTLTGVQSRKVHGSAGALDLPIDAGKSISGAVSVEPRSIGTGHVIVFQFDQAVTLGPANTFDLTDEAGTTLIGQPGIGMILGQTPGATNEVAATLTGLADNRRVTILINDIVGADLNSLNVRASVGFLLGDVNGSRMVDATDTQRVKSRSGLSVVGAGKEFDFNASGLVSAADVAAVKVAGGKALVPGNTAPIVSAGGNQSVNFPATVTLNGMATDDGFPIPPGLPSVTWSTAAGPATAVFANANVAQTTATLPQAGVYTLRLTASDGQLSSSADAIITATSGTATSATLTFPASAGAGTANDLTVTLRDAQNAIAANYTGTVHFTSNDPQATLPPDYTFTAMDAGVHTFSGVLLRTVGTRTITATFDSGPGPTNTTAIVQAAVPSALAFVQQPLDGTVRSSLMPPVSVAINDAFGNRTTSTAAVGLAIAINPGNAALTGTTSQSAISGLASFNSLSFTNEGVGVTLQATAMGLPPVNSSTFTIVDNINPATPTDLSADSVQTTQSNITLRWSAPGDDGMLGAAASYSLKAHTSPITAVNFASVGAVVLTSAPSSAGISESATANGLDANTLYYFALRVDDGAGNQVFAFASENTLACDTGYSGPSCAQCANGYVSSGPTCVPICAASNPCTMPPGSSCASATSLTTFSNPGTCAPAGTTPFYSCSYTPMITDCASIGFVCSTTGGPASCRTP